MIRLLPKDQKVIEAMVDRANAINQGPPSEGPYSGFTYADGVVTALQWVLGRIHGEPVTESDLEELPGGEQER